MVWILAVSLIALGGVIAVLAVGGRPDPTTLRATAPLLDGAWRFHIGDDPRWADADADDSDWETMDLSAPASSIDGDVGLPNYVGGWMAHGHPGYQGYAWYRRTVTVPAGDHVWDVLGPTAVEDGYELYWNGVRLGGSGRLGGAFPRVVGTRPMIFALPADAAGQRAVIAIRAFMQPGSDANPDSGGVHVAPMLAPRPESQALYRAQWWRTIAGYIVEVIEPLAMFAVVGLALVIRPRSSHADFIAFSCIALVLWALKRLDNAIVSWTDLLSLPTYAWLNALWTPLSLIAWTLAWNRWRLRPSRVIDGATLVLAVAGVAGSTLHAAAMTRISRFGLLTLLLLIVVRIFRDGPMRTTAVATMTSILVAHFAGELSSIGVPVIWFPFGIGVTLAQYAYAIAMPLVALLIVRTSQDQSDSASIGRGGLPALIL